MCTKKGILHLIVEASQFDLICGAEELVSYRFNTGVAEHKFCRQCGIHAFYTPRSDPDKGGREHPLPRRRRSFDARTPALRW
jgi:hypothetical protein